MFTPVRVDSLVEEPTKPSRLPAPLICVQRICQMVLKTLNSVTVQSITYLVFVIVFQVRLALMAVHPHPDCLSHLTLRMCCSC